MTGRPSEVEDWLRQRDEPQRAQAESLATLVHAAGSEVEEAVKWGRLTFTADENWHHWLCAVAATKRGVTLMFHKGALLDDPQRLLRGEGRYLRHVPHDRAASNPEAVTALVRQAVERQSEMLE
jgi:hypothetical protein